MSTQEPEASPTLYIDVYTRVMAFATGWPLGYCRRLIVTAIEVGELSSII